MAQYLRLTQRCVRLSDTRQSPPRLGRSQTGNRKCVIERLPGVAPWASAATGVDQSRVRRALQVPIEAATVFT